MARQHQPFLVISDLLEQGSSGDVHLENACLQ
jgi:hypothetical protein